MNNIKILKKAVIKAVENGWEEGKEIMLDNMELCSGYYANYDVYSSFIFSHSFAKAFWGETICNKFPDIICNYDHSLFVEMTKAPIYKYHLQQMVIEEEPLKYLERFI